MCFYSIYVYTHFHTFGQYFNAVERLRAHRDLSMQFTGAAHTLKKWYGGIFNTYLPVEIQY